MGQAETKDGVADGRNIKRDRKRPTISRQTQTGGAGTKAGKKGQINTDRRRRQGKTKTHATERKNGIGTEFV